MRVQHQFGGVKVGTGFGFSGKLGLGTLALISWVTVQGQVARGVMECWTLAQISRAALCSLQPEFLGSLLQLKHPKN